jgi:GNAT superfamily N-acetyltransferase
MSGKIDFAYITACGENCEDCAKKAEGNCEGCLETDGRCKEWAQPGQCPVHRCARDHGVRFCGLCSAFPCVELTKKIHWNPHVVERLTNLADTYHKMTREKSGLREIHAPNEKSAICSNILRALPHWFGVEASIADYVENVRQMPFFAVFDENKPIGFAALKEHNSYTAEVCVMGVLPERHRSGFGRMLVERCVRYCEETRREFLTVKTLDSSRKSVSYEKTRLFYLAMGFRPLEVFPLFWDADNPCLFMVKAV